MIQFDLQDSILKKALLFIFITAACFAAGCGGSATTSVTNIGSRVQGYVYCPVGGVARSANAPAGLMPISDARISISESTYYAETDENGYFALDGVSPGARTLTISKAGFISVNLYLDILPETTITISTAGSSDAVLYPESSGALSVSSTPASATIFLDSTATGLFTPYTFSSVAAGTHTVSVTFSDNGQHSTETVTITTGATQSVSFVIDTYACYSDSDCDDGNSYTIDSCSAPSTASAACGHSAVRCITNSDCDDANPRTADTCASPGNADSSCSSTTIPITCPVANTDMSTDRFYILSYLPWFTTAPDYEHWTWQDRNPALGAPHSSVYTPLMGLYDSRESSTAMTHLMQMKSAGFNGVAINWYGQNTTTDTVTRQFVDKIESLPCSFGFLIMTDAEPYRWNYDYNDPARKALFFSDMMYLADTFFSREDYLTVDGRPAVIHFRKAFDDGKNVANPIMDLAIPIAWWDEIQQKLIDERGIDIAFIPLNSNEYVGHSDGMFGWFEQTSDNPDDYGIAYYNWFLPYTKWLRADVADVPENYFIIHTILPGFDDSGVYAWTLDPNEKRIINRVIGGKETIDITYEYLTDYNTTYPDYPVNCLHLATFNDWNEGSQIEASVEFGIDSLKDAARIGADFGMSFSQLTESQWNAFKNYIENVPALTAEQRESMEYLFFNENLIDFEAAASQL